MKMEWADYAVLIELPKSAPQLEDTTPMRQTIVLHKVCLYSLQHTQSLVPTRANKA